ncbi:hypothetical protein NOF55_22840 [Rhizobiaceae bacterium BDR2-2]|uniref:Uncharacterized protein n=1 Tax=Ectorhizobium quercum TaxID=2965071 RepID=A0AAE3N7E5_9HYPH|nr:hypothetical protein [Ectorhizobium quercum]MCX8999947.1 hypothetical protein [Ectorhizobium quercum]
MIVILPAVVGAITALITILLRDLFLPRINEVRTKRKSEEAIYSDYVRPIAVSLQDLLWRLDEIINKPGRGAYLSQPAGSSNYAEYKRISTVYRLAVVIAWFRGFERELLTLRSVDFLESDRLRVAMGEFRSVLADGKSVEIQRLEKVMDLLHVKHPEQIEKEYLALRVENILDKTLGAEKSKGVRTLSAHEAEECILKILHEIKEHAGSDDVRLDIQGSELRSLIEILSIHQTWIYRDWQAAIGDAMLVIASSGSRKFDIMGFGEFEDLWITGKPRWMERLAELFINFEPSGNVFQDARKTQISDLLLTTSRLLVSLSEYDSSVKKAMETTINKAQSLSENIDAK